MNYRRIGNTGLKVSEISLGAWVNFGGQIEDNTAHDLVHTAFDNGINFFDCADTYENGKAEKVLGQAIKDIPRSELVISSKVFFPTMKGPNGRGLSRKHITDSIKRTLKNLKLDYIDIYYCHRFDADTPIEETCRTMDDLIHKGKILYWGTSEWTPAQITEAHGICRQYNLIPPAVDQPQYSLIHRQRVEETLMPVVSHLGIGLTTFSPLASGVLTGKYNDGIPEGSRALRDDMSWMKDRLTDEALQPVRAFTAYAESLGLVPAQLAIAWILRRPEISSVITGATKLSQLESNLKAEELTTQLGAEVYEKLDEIFKGF